MSPIASVAIVGLCLGFLPGPAFSQSIESSTNSKPTKAFVDSGGLTKNPVRETSYTLPEIDNRISKPQRPDAQAEKKWNQIGLYFAQLLDAKEKAYYSLHKKYAADKQLFKSPVVGNPAQAMTAKFGSNVMHLWAWGFRIYSSSDGQKYLLSVYATRAQVTREEVKCLPAFISNEAGIVYKGRRIGCH